jgi:transposase-like protein
MRSCRSGPPARGRSASRLQDEDARSARALKARPFEHAGAAAEQTRILEALRETRGNISQAADRLGVTRNILRYRLKKYGLQATADTTEPPAEPVNPTLESAPTPRAAYVQWERRHVALLRADLV